MARSAFSSRAGRLAAALVAGGATTVLTSWTVGKLLQNDLIVRPSREVYEYVRARRSPQLARRLEQTVTGMGDYPVLVPFSLLVGGLVAYERRDWLPLPLLVGGLASEVYLQKMLKVLVKSSKPPEEYSVGPSGRLPFRRRGPHGHHLRPPGASAGRALGLAHGAPGYLVYRTCGDSCPGGLAAVPRAALARGRPRRLVVRLADPALPDQGNRTRPGRVNTASLKSRANEPRRQDLAATTRSRSS